MAPGASAVIVLTRVFGSGDPDPLVNTVDALYQVDGFPNQLTSSAACSVTNPTGVLEFPPTGGLAALVEDSSNLILFALIGLTLIGGSAWIVWSNRRWNNGSGRRS